MWCWHPCGVQFRSRFTTGGVALLNPRLIAGTPAGVLDFLPVETTVIGSLGRKVRCRIRYHTFH